MNPKAKAVRLMQGDMKDFDFQVRATVGWILKSVGDWKVMLWLAAAIMKPPRLLAFCVPSCTYR